MIDGCDDPQKSRGMCGKHYARDQRAKYGQCAVDVCTNGATNRKGWCAKHYMRVLTHGTTDEPPSRRKMPLVCTVGGCDKPTRARGWCSTHYARWRSHGTTDLVDPPKEMYCRGCRTWFPREEYNFSMGRCRPCGSRVKSDTNRFRAYRVHRKEIDAKLAEQGHACAICRTPMADLPGAPHTDHCHVTNVFRGMLCGECNLGLGKFKDSPELLEAAAAYLRSAK